MMPSNGNQSPACFIQEGKFDVRGEVFGFYVQEQAVPFMMLLSDRIDIYLPY